MPYQNAHLLNGATESSRSASNSTIALTMNREQQRLKMQKEFYICIEIIMFSKMTVQCTVYSTATKTTEHII